VRRLTLRSLSGIPLHDDRGTERGREVAIIALEARTGFRKETSWTEPPPFGWALIEARMATDGEGGGAGARNKSGTDGSDVEIVAGRGGHRGEGLKHGVPDGAIRHTRHSLD
jgi:hypothetical protein